MIMTIGNLAFSSNVLYKKQNLTGYIQYYKQNGGTDTKDMGQTKPHFLSDPMSDRKKEFSPICVIFTKNSTVHDLAWRKCS